MSDTISQALARGLGPKTGMQRIPFPSESYEHPSLPLSAQRLLNFYSETEPSNARATPALIPTPGLSVDAVYGAGPLLQMNTDQPGVEYYVSGTEFYRQRSTLSGFAVDDLGPIGSPATDVLPATALMVTIAVGPTACVVCVPPNAFTCTHSGSLAQITDPDFPGAASVTYLNGYWVFKNYDNGTQFFISGLLNPLTYDALDFANADGTGALSRIITHRGELWLGGQNGFEVWYTSGDADFPFRRQSGGVISFGVATPKSLARGDNSVFWVGIDGSVYRSVGYQGERISTHALEVFIQAHDPNAVSYAMTHSQGGHVFYVFTLAGQTFAYDCATKKWADRASSADGSGPWLPCCAGNRGGVQLLGDSTSGQVFFTDPASGAENGVEVFRQATCPPIWAGANRAFMNRLELEMETGGVGPGTTLKVEWSDDGGWTWKGSRSLDAGTFSQRAKRVATTRLGSFRQRVMRVSAVGHTTLYAMDADLTQPLAGG